jgi:hypothetical protein
VDGVPAIRAIAGPELADGSPEPGRARALWFDADGKLIRAALSGVDVRYSAFREYDGVQIPQEIRGFRDGKLGIFIRVTTIGPPEDVAAVQFKMPGHVWKRQFTAEVR